MHTGPMTIQEQIDRAVRAAYATGDMTRIEIVAAVDATIERINQETAARVYGSNKA